MPGEHLQQQGSAPKPVGQELIIPALAVGFTVYYFWTVEELAWEAKANGRSRKSGSPSSVRSTPFSSRR